VRLLKAAVVVLALAGAMGMAAGCGGTPKARKIAPDPRFSINLVEVPADWPDERIDWPRDNATLAAQQQAVYEQYGKPDYFRLLWKRDGRMMTNTEFQNMAWQRRAKAGKRKEQIETPDLEWVYLDDKLTFQFTRGKVVKGELPDTTRIVTEYGDPHEIKETIDVTKAPNVVYQYYDQGKVFYFREGKLYREENQTPMPAMNMRK